VDEGAPIQFRADAQPTGSKSTPERFFADLPFAFRLQFGRDLSPAERKSFSLAQHSVKAEEEKNGDREKKRCLDLF
jgi:hypothetical protein